MRSNTKSRITIVTLLAAASLLATMGLARASERTVCYNIIFRDDRDDCPFSGDAGVRRACQQSYLALTGAAGSYSNPVGMSLEIWDHDSTSDDEYIGTWKIGDTGTRCATFEWEGASYSKGEANPDPYIVLKSTVHAVGGDDTSVQAVGSSGAEYGGVSWRSYYLSECRAGMTCTIDGYLAATTDSTTQRGGRLQALDSAQHMLQVYASVMDDDEIDMMWPCETSAAYGRQTFTIEGSGGSGCKTTGTGAAVGVGQTVAHEVGHVLQMMMFEQDSLVDVCGSSHSLTGTEYESCATTEGFAEYVGAISFWDPSDTGSQPSRYGFDFEEAEPLEPKCSDNSAIEGMVARSFWDISDRNNEAAGAPAPTDDETWYGATYIALGWDVFPDGTGDGEDREADDDGVNMWDYYDNNSSRFNSTFMDTFLYHNCVNYQH
jgi:hypothetical protein